MTQVKKINVPAIAECCQQDGADDIPGGQRELESVPVSVWCQFGAVRELGHPNADSFGQTIMFWTCNGASDVQGAAVDNIVGVCDLDSDARRGSGSKNLPIRFLSISQKIFCIVHPNLSSRLALLVLSVKVNACK
jgi:hypothetical protein